MFAQPKSDHYWGEYIKNVWDSLSKADRIGENDFKMPPFYHVSPEMRKYFARVYNSIKLTDNKIGDLLYRLDKNGLRDNTIILFYSDQGEGIPRGKTNGINFGHRVPFVIGFPQKYKNLSPWGTSGTVSGELGDFEDLAPTILSLAGAKMPDYLKGHLELSSDRAHN